MKLLRQLIRKLILEGPVKDSFDEAWFNTEEERNQFVHSDVVDSGTHHKDNLKNMYPEDSGHHEDIEEFF